MRQLQLFSGAEVAAMRDRTERRNYSPQGDAFRRDHKRRPAFGLEQRHALRARRLRDGELVSQNGFLVHRRSDPPAPDRPASAVTTSGPPTPVDSSAMRGASELAAVAISAAVGADGLAAGQVSSGADAGPPIERTQPATRPDGPIAHSVPREHAYNRRPRRRTHDRRPRCPATTGVATATRAVCRPVSGRRSAARRRTAERACAPRAAVGREVRSPTDRGAGPQPPGRPGRVPGPAGGASPGSRTVPPPDGASAGLPSGVMHHRLRPRSHAPPGRKQWTGKRRTAPLEMAWKIGSGCLTAAREKWH